MVKEREWLWLWLLAAMLVFGAGCNHSRYGVHHDQRLVGIQRIGVMVPTVKVYSLHTGGLLEERPDMAPGVDEATAAAITEEVGRCNREPVLVKVPPPSPDQKNNPVVERSALLRAISEAIVTHHYKFGKERIIDYTSGDAPKVLGQDDVDALLCVDVCGVVPTAGRKALRTTAMVVGIVTRIYVPVSGNQATVTAMLVDAKTGEILWFNSASNDIKVTNQKDFRKLCKKACERLLKPSK